jgi:DNA-binding transcriptional ArsR family regulator
MDQNLREQVAQLHAQICSGLADANRIMLLYALANGSLNVGELSLCLELPQPAVSRHLKILRERDIVLAHRNGQSVTYTVSDQRIIQALDLLRAVLADQLEGQGMLASTAASLTQENKQ